MAYSSIVGADTAPAQPSGRDAGALGPSDNTDSGSDTVGTFEAQADTDAAGTGERGAVTPGFEGREGGDIMPDRIVDLAGAEVAADDGDADALLEDLDSADADVDPQAQDDDKF